MGWAANRAICLDSWFCNPARAAHAAKVDAWTARRLERASHGRRHPVDDFLFEYYPTRPGHLRRWHPGLGIALRLGPASPGDAYDYRRGAFPRRYPIVNGA